MISKDRAFKLEKEMKNKICDSALESLNLMPSQNRIKISCVKKKQKLHTTAFPCKYNDVEVNQKEKFSEINEKQGHYKRKFQEETCSLTERKVEKRKRVLAEPKKRSNTDQNNQNITKVKSSIHSKNTSNLLNYFSKSTPEQSERRLKQTRITIKAEIHDSKGLQVPHLLDTQREQNFKLKDVNSRTEIEEYDEILLVQSETITLSPKIPHDNEPNSLLLQSKPKWSLKIQLQSNGIQRPDIDDEMYMPTALSAQLKDNMKNFREIPKVLLPLKNKRQAGLNKTSSLINENQKKRSKNLKNNIETVKTELEKNKVLPIAKSDTNLNFEIKKENKFKAEKKIDGSNRMTFDKQDILDKRPSGELAPLFLKKLKPNAENMVAKHLFIQVESNEHTDDTEEKKIELMVPDISSFPKISHINQIISNVDGVEILNIYGKTQNFVEKKLFQPSINYSTVKTILKPKTCNWIPHKIYKPVKIDIYSALAQLKTHYSDVENLWETISKLSKSNNFRAKGIKMKQEKMPTHIMNSLQSSCLWTDKYKPNKSYKVLGNERAVSKLKTWLQNWQSLKCNENYSSSEEFYTSDSYLSNEMITDKVAVLIGPHGSGKTASVYALAQELGYMVLEVNASAKRPGKKILKEFEEATKSHRVKNVDVENFFAIPSSNIEEADNISKNSLILMEDIDLIFEEDDGFISATFQLASNTKRPIVMTLKSPCLHLAKMASQQLQINFKPIDSNKIIVLLQLIALAETGYQLSENCISVLCQYGDLRKSLLQLQYLLISGGKRILHNSLAVNDISWSNMTTYIYKPAIQAHEERKREEYKYDEIINNLLENLDDFSLVSSLMNIKDPTSIPINVKYEQSTSFIQNALPYSSLDDISLEIGNWINNSMKYSVPNEYTHEIFKTPSRAEHINHINSILSKIPLSSLDHQSVSLDYLPSIRNICRAEKVRNELNFKRGNRFFHYLQNSKLLTGSKNSFNIFSAACKMLQE